MKPKGAAFEVSEPQKFIRQMLPTDCAFGPDGAFYWSDWTTGWDKPGKGRIFRVTDPEAMKNPDVAEAKKLIAEGFEKRIDGGISEAPGVPASAGAAGGSVRAGIAEAGRCGEGVRSTC